MMIMDRGIIESIEEDYLFRDKEVIDVVTG
jgi:hypothetical protein